MYNDIRLFIKHLESSNYSHNTITSYEIHLRNYYSFCRQKDIDYKVITPKQLLEYRAVLSKMYKMQSINGKVSAIKQFYNFLIDIEEVQINPIRDNFYIRGNRSNPKPLTKDEKHLFISFIEQKEKHISLGFKLIFDTGIRISELVNLKKENFVDINNKAFLNIENGKRDKQRIVPIFSSAIIEELLQYMEGIYKGKIFNYSERAYQLYAEEFTEKFHIHFTTHMARHTFATEKINEGMRIDILQKILGHSDIRTTMMYAKTDENQILELGGTIYG